VIRVLAATATELTKLQPVWRSLFILGRNVVATLAVLTLQHNVISRHFLISNSDCRLSIDTDYRVQSAIGNWQSAMPLLNHF
jgi:hypothetical protein